MRFRIALATALAVTVIPALILTLFSTSPAASARADRQVAMATSRSPERPVALKLNLMSYAQAEKASRLVTFYQEVELQKEEAYLRYVAFLKYLTEVGLPQGGRRTAAGCGPAAAAPQVQPSAPPTPSALPTPAPAGSDATSTNTPDWACIRQHESGGNYAEGGGGAYQFEFGTWNSLTGLPSPAEAYPASVQDAAALKLYAERGFEPWTTRYVCGL